MVGTFRHMRTPLTETERARVMLESDIPYAVSNKNLEMFAVIFETVWRLIVETL